MKIEVNLPDDMAKFYEERAAMLVTTPEKLMIETLDAVLRSQSATDKMFVASQKKVFDKHSQAFESLAKSEE